MIVTLASCELGTSIPDWMNVPLNDIVPWAESIREHQDEQTRYLRKSRNVRK